MHPEFVHERTLKPVEVVVGGVVSCHAPHTCPVASASTALHSVQSCAVSQVAADPGMWSSRGTGLVSGACVQPVLEQERVSTPGSSHVAGVVIAQLLMS